MSNVTNQGPSMFGRIAFDASHPVVSGLVAEGASLATVKWGAHHVAPAGQWQAGAVAAAASLTQRLVAAIFDGLAHLVGSKGDFLKNKYFQGVVSYGAAAAAGYATAVKMEVAASAAYTVAATALLSVVVVHAVIARVSPGTPAVNGSTGS